MLGCSRYRWWLSIVVAVVLPCFCAQNFYPNVTTVTILDRLCDGVVVTDSSMTSLSCVAPPGTGAGVLVVTVANSLDEASYGFTYEHPIVSSVAPSPTFADTSAAIMIFGSNLGMRGTLPDPIVTVGAVICGSMNVLNTTTLACTLPSSDVGRFNITVSLNGLSNADAGNDQFHRVTLDRLCGDNRFGLPGQRCGPCPKVLFIERLCNGFLTRVGRTVFLL